MDILLIPYIINIIILIPVTLGTLFNMKQAVQPAFEESAGYRTVAGAFWAAILVLSVLGLFYPYTFIPVLMAQVIYKALWLLVFFLPRVVTKSRRHEIDWVMSGVFIALLIAWPFIIPWQAVFS